MLTVQIIFWVAVGGILYTLVGYPLLTLVLAAIVNRRIDKRPITPKVSMIIAAYNEEEVIGAKLDQTLQLDYPRERLEIIVASDGSTDRTDEIVRSYADRGVKLYRAEGRRGKTNALNETVATATGDILVFSDATGIYNPESIRELVANFNDPRVGCVTGRVTYKYFQAVNAQGFKVYQRFAVAVRQAESRFGSQTSVSGSIHAIRRSLYQPANPAFSLDVIDAVHAVQRHQLVIYEPQALSLEEARTSARAEFRCRVRISVRGSSMVPYILSRLIASREWGYLFQMFSHKILRWWLWLMLLVALVTNLVLMPLGGMYLVLGGLQLLFYACGMLGLASAARGARLPLVSSISFFLLSNAAMCVGALKALFGRRMPAWEPVR